MHLLGQKFISISPGLSNKIEMWLLRTSVQCSYIDSSGYASGPIKICLFIDYIIMLLKCFKMTYVISLTVICVCVSSSWCCGKVCWGGGGGVQVFLSSTWDPTFSRGRGGGVKTIELVIFQGGGGRDLLSPIGKRT